MALDFPQQEYERRVARLKQLMRESDLEGLIITSEHTHRYLTGHRSRRWLFDNCPIISLYTADGDATIICDTFEERQVAATSWVTQVRCYPGPATCIEPIMKNVESILNAMGLNKARIGAELGTMQRLGIPFADFERLRCSMPCALFVDASQLLWRLRSVKSQCELDAMREAITLTNRAREYVYANLGDGMTERGVTQAMTAELARLGSEPGGYVIARHLDSPLPQQDRLFRSGEILYIDAGAVVRGYVADCCRCVALGRIDEQRHEGFQILWEVQQAALRPVRAGERVAAIISAYQAEIKRFQRLYSQISFGSLSDYIGHGIGMEVCEPPSLGEAEGNVMLEEGTTLMIEPSFAWREDLYINEEPIVVTAKSYELLGALAPRDPRVV